MRLKSGTLRVLLIKTRHLSEFRLLCLKGFLTDFLLRYRRKHLRNRTEEFIDALRRTMGVRMVVLQGYKQGDKIKALL